MVTKTTYALLGSTGNTGTALIEQILRDTDIKVNAYCRNKRKLYDLIPKAIDNKQIEVYEGSIQDSELLTRCIDGTQAVFLLASTNTNVPYCHISQDLVNSLLPILRAKRAADPTATLPKLVLLSSATIDPHLNRHMGFFYHIMSRAASFVYNDLIEAEKLLRAEESWLTTIYIKPGGLSVDIQNGHRLTLDEEETFVSYADIAAGMLEAIGDKDGKWDLKNVGIVNSGKKAKFAPGTPGCIFFGLIRHFIPSLHPYLPTGGPT